jgi:hypothetical protein
MACCSEPEVTTNMPRFIVRYCGKGTKPAADVEQIRSLDQTKVLDESPRMLLLEAPETALRSAIGSMPDWMVSAVKSYAAPCPSPVLEKTKNLKPPK